MVDSRKRNFQLPDDQSPATDDDESAYEDEDGSTHDLVKVYRWRARPPYVARKQNDHVPAVSLTPDLRMTGAAPRLGVGSAPET